MQEVQGWLTLCLEERLLPLQVKSAHEHQSVQPSPESHSSSGV